MSHQYGLLIAWKIYQINSCRGTLVNKFASVSPYNFADNNPIWKIYQDSDSTHYYSITLKKDLFGDRVVGPKDGNDPLTTRWENAP